MSIDTHLLIATFIDTHGFDPQGVYCQLTGAKIGTFTDSEFDRLVESLGGMDTEEIVDDVAMRVLASMRPSIRWNKMRDKSLEEMRVTVPEELLAYMLNRLFAPLNHRKLGIDSLLGYYADRIKTYQFAESWGRTDATNTLLYMLLELDAKFSLDMESPPFNSFDFLYDCPTMDHRVELLQVWYDRRMTDWQKKVKDDEMQVAWATSRSGNPYAKPAFMGAYMDGAPISKTKAAKLAKSEEMAFMQGLLSEIRMGRVESVEEGQAVEPKPVFKPIRKMPMTFGVA